jgi:branched-chain amino acid transport system permease protein
MNDKTKGPTIGLQHLGYALLAIVLMALALYPPLDGGFRPQQATVYLIYGLLAFSVALIVGYARLFNIGIGVTFGMSAYTVAILSQHGVHDPILLFLAAIGAGLAISVLFGIYAMVASGIEYMMLTFLTTIAMSKVPNLATKLTGGDNGLIVKGGLDVSFGLNPLFGNEFYYFVLAVVVACMLLCWYVLASQAGKAVRAIGRNPQRAAAMGYHVSQYRVALTLLAGFVAAVAGWLFALQRSFVSEDLLGLSNSLNGLVYALVGGVDHILGPLAGAAGFRYLTENLSRRSTQSSLYIGITLLIVVYLMPNGILGLLRTLARHVPIRRRAGAAEVVEPGPLETEEPIAAATADEPRVL